MIIIIYHRLRFTVTRNANLFRDSPAVFLTVSYVGTLDGFLLCDNRSVIVVGVPQLGEVILVDVAAPESLAY